MSAAFCISFFDLCAFVNLSLNQDTPSAGTDKKTLLYSEAQDINMFSRTQMLETRLNPCPKQNHHQDLLATKSDTHSSEFDFKRSGKGHL